MSEPPAQRPERILQPLGQRHIALTTARDAKLAKTISGHGEEALARRVAEQAGRAVERHMDRLAWQKRAAILIRGMATGYWLAHWELSGFALPAVVQAR
jgi:hypothetical protein